jgi:putative tricarboxylic transport membrane protein
VTSGAGGGTDNFARIIQSIITKHKLMEQPIVVVNKGGGSGAEGYVYGKGAKGDPNRVIFGTNNAYLLPYVAKLGYKFSDLTPVAALALDEFLLWVNGMRPMPTPRAISRRSRPSPWASRWAAASRRTPTRR